MVGLKVGVEVGEGGERVGVRVVVDEGVPLGDGLWDSERRWLAVGDRDAVREDHVGVFPETVADLHSREHRELICSCVQWERVSGALHRRRHEAVVEWVSCRVMKRVTHCPWPTAPHPATHTHTPTHASAQIHVGIACIPAVCTGFRACSRPHILTLLLHICNLTPPTYIPNQYVHYHPNACRPYVWGTMLRNPQNAARQPAAKIPKIPSPLSQIGPQTRFPTRNQWGEGGPAPAPACGLDCATDCVKIQAGCPIRVVLLLW